MNETYLGGFDEVVLLSVTIRTSAAYGAATVNESEGQLSRCEMPHRQL